jgi:hypothetical protein
MENEEGVKEQIISACPSPQLRVTSLSMPSEGLPLAAAILAHRHLFQQGKTCIHSRQKGTLLPGYDVGFLFTLVWISDVHMSSVFPSQSMPNIDWPL